VVKVLPEQEVVGPDRPNGAGRNPLSFCISGGPCGGGENTLWAEIGNPASLLAAR